MSRLMHPWADVAPGDTHAVIADDSDCLLMAAMAATRQHQHVFVLSEAQHGRSIVFGPDGVARGTAKEGLKPLAKAAAARKPPAKGRLHFYPRALIPAMKEFGIRGHGTRPTASGRELRRLEFFGKLVCVRCMPSLCGAGMGRLLDRRVFGKPIASMRLQPKKLRPRALVPELLRQAQRVA